MIERERKDHKNFARKLILMRHSVIYRNHLYCCSRTKGETMKLKIWKPEKGKNIFQAKITAFVKQCIQRLSKFFLMFG